MFAVGNTSTSTWCGPKTRAVHREGSSKNSETVKDMKTMGRGIAGTQCAHARYNLSLRFGESGWQNAFVNVH